MSRKQRRTAVQRQQNRPSAPVSVPATLSQKPAGGPRTPEGKAISSQNAFSHGLTSACLVLPWEDENEFDSLLDQLAAEHRPATATEGLLVREIAEQYWRLQRARNHEHILLVKTTEILERGSDLDTFEVWDKEVKLTQRYATRHERAFHKCLSTLRTLQKERRAAETEAAAEARTEAQAESSTAAHQPAEFVSQNSKDPVIPADYALECPSVCPSVMPVSDTERSRPVHLLMLGHYGWLPDVNFLPPVKYLKNL